MGVGAVTSRKLRDAGLDTVGDLASAGEMSLGSLVGRASGRHLYALSMARDPRPVEVGRRRRSIGSQRALGRRPKTQEDLEATIVAIVDRLGKRLRKAQRVCRTVVLRLRFDDFTRATRSRTLYEPTDGTQVLMSAARGLLDEAMPIIRGRGCTLIGLSLTSRLTACVTGLARTRSRELFCWDGIPVCRCRCSRIDVVRVIEPGPGLRVRSLPRVRRPSPSHLRRSRR